MKIKKVTTHRQFEEDSFINEIVKYDINGNVIETTTFYEDGDVESKVVTNFNEKNYKSEIITYVDNNDFAEKSVFVWDKNDKLEYEEIQYADGSFSKRIYEKNDDDNSLTIKLVDEENELEEMEVLKFDNNKNLIQKISFDEDKKIVRQIENIFDQENVLVQVNEYEGKDKLVSQQKYFYDDNKNLIKRVTSNAQNKVLNSIKITYDDQNRITEQNIDNNYFINIEYDDANNSQIEQRSTGNGMIQSSKTSKYNENKLLIEESGTEGTKIFEYEFYED